MVERGSGGLARVRRRAWGIDPSTSRGVDQRPPRPPRSGARHVARRLGGGAGAPVLAEPRALARCSGPASPPRTAAPSCERLGYRHVRTFWHMSRRLDGSERAGSPPDGVTIRAFRDGDGPALHRVLETIVRGHFGSEPMAYDAWEAATLRAPSSDLSLVFLAERGGELVGALTTASTTRSLGGRAGRARSPSRGRGSAGRSCGRPSPSWPLGAGDRQAQRGRRERAPGPLGSTRASG